MGQKFLNSKHGQMIGKNEKIPVNGKMLRVMECRNQDTLLCKIMEARYGSGVLRSGNYKDCHGDTENNFQVIMYIPASVAMYNLIFKSSPRISSLGSVII